MAADKIVIPMYPGEDGLTATIRLDGQDLTGKVVEMEARPFGRVEPILFSTEDGGLSLDLPDGIVVSYGADLIEDLPEGRLTTLDLFTVSGSARKKIAVGDIVIGSAGNLLNASLTIVQIPGIQGRSVNVILVEPEDWPPPDDEDPLNWYVRVVA